MNIDELAQKCFESARAKGFWDAERNFGESIALMHSELSEALEGYRKDRKDDHLPQYDQWQVELADAIIRILDWCGAKQVPLQEIIDAKMAYNSNRPYKHGSKF